MQPVTRFLLTLVGYVISAAVTWGLLFCALAFGIWSAKLLWRVISQ